MGRVMATFEPVAFETDEMTTSADNKDGADTVAAGTSDSSQQQQCADAGVTVSDDDGFTLTTSDHDDEVVVRQLTDRRLLVEVNGKPIELTKEQSANLTINTGDGDDTVDIARAVKRGVTVDGGTGDDTILGGSGNDRLSGSTGVDTIKGRGGDDKIFGGSEDDELVGGEGHDHLEGRGGNDQLSGGDGNDSAYGGAGDDQLTGGDGQDYLEGQTGVDRLDGGADDDVLSGGEDADHLSGEAGSDLVLTGTGRDRVKADSLDTVNATHDAEIDGIPAVVTRIEPRDTPANIEVEGTPEFVARVRSDLQALAFTKEGQKILASIGGTEHVVRITESPNNGCWAIPFGEGDPWIQQEGTPGSGRSVEVQLRPGDPSSLSVGPGDEDHAPSKRRIPPIVTLFHELVHAEQRVNGTLEPGSSKERNLTTGAYTGRDSHEVKDGSGDKETNNRELDAIGLAFEPDRDGDRIPDKDPTMIPHPTENSFREELGIEPRTEY